jgi:Dimerisation domain of Zinc Transporter
MKIAGRAYVFMRWSGGQHLPGMMGELGWAFESNDRLGRFQSFYCGSTESRSTPGRAPRRLFWFEQCFTLPELIKRMSNGTERLGFDEVKVIDVADAHSELALQALTQIAASPEDVLNRIDPLEQTRELLMHYGVRSLAHTRAFNAPFLWYNMLPGRSVPVRKLPVHLFQIRALQAMQEAAAPGELEQQIRSIVDNDPDVRSLGECVVVKAGIRFFVGLDIAVDPLLSVGKGRKIADRIEQAIRLGTPKAAHIFVRVEPFDKEE